MAGARLLEVTGLRAGYGEAEIVRGCSLAVDAGELVVLIGPNGAGKSTLVKAIMGLVAPRAGRVRLAGADTTGLPPERMAALGAAYVPQVVNVFPSLTVAENLDLGAWLRRDRAAARLARERVLALFPNLGNRLGQRAAVLSGGERQMLAVGRALMMEPRLLLLDEPSAGLAPAMVEAIFAKIKEVNAEGVAVAMVEQNARRALAMADRGLVLDAGKVALEGPGPGLLADPEVGRLYLGHRAGPGTGAGAGAGTGTGGGGPPDPSRPGPGPGP